MTIKMVSIKILLWMIIYNMKRTSEIYLPVRGLRPFNADRNSFDPIRYTIRLERATNYIKERLPSNFTPLITLVPGSRGLDLITNHIDLVADPIDYNDIPGFPRSLHAQHDGKLHAGFLEKVPIIIMRRRHLYEEGDRPNLVTALKNITFPVYLAKFLGSKIYFATNAAGGLNLAYKVGDFMAIKTHLTRFFPDAAFGPPLPFEDRVHFPRQHTHYNPELRSVLRQAADNVDEKQSFREGVYAAITGRHFEAPPDSKLLRLLGVDAVGMSTVPEIQVAGRLGMETMGGAFISDIIDEDGITVTTIDQIREMKHDPVVLGRIFKITKETIRLVGTKFTTE